MNKHQGLWIAILLCALVRPLSAVVILDFEGLQDLEPVEEFYNGGLGGFGSGPGPNLGISFPTNALAIVDADAGGSGNFGGEPTPSTILFFLTGGATTMNVPGGFDTGFSFFYSAINSPGFINVFDGLDGTGNLLVTLDLALTPFDGAPDPSGNFSPLVPIGVAFNGVAMSVDFGGTLNQIGFDNITFGSSTPSPGPATAVPEPASLLLLASGLAGLVGFRRLRSKPRQS